MGMSGTYDVLVLVGFLCDHHAAVELEATTKCQLPNTTAPGDALESLRVGQLIPNTA